MEVKYNMNVGLRSGEGRTFMLRLEKENTNENHILGFLRGGLAYEPDVTKLVQRILEPGDVFIDVGANVGYFTMLASTIVGPEGKVYSYEPDPKNIERIRYHASYNFAENIEIVSRPVSSGVEDVKFYFNKSSSGGNALWNPGEFFGNPDFNDGYTVMKSTTLAAEFAERGLDKAKLIKIDTEGAEHAILRGAQELLEGQTVPYIIAELNHFGLGKLGSSADQFISFMYDSGYLGFLLYFDGRPPQFVCPGTEVNTACICNLLFTTVEGFAKIWSSILHNPGVIRDKDGKLSIAVGDGQVRQWGSLGRGAVL